ncbi:amidohydrolase [Maribellus luteus]|uniref:Amidohydrolase n=1 Tax=Maribellus luteus TaxID=2305463 RepID=A0A399T6U1_9BACT|nr:amidohydrolase family protein [Maribellus luteus]RIJ49871.1 amidohydrolase [Maribellus luteus]
MRKLAATYIFPGNRPPVKNGLLVCDDDGTVVELQERADNWREEAGVEYYSGVIVPGFVNAHCHLELSHLHKKVAAKTGMGGFLGQINKLRKAEPGHVLKAMQLADRLMWAAGIAAVGDVSNSGTSIPVKQNSKITYHTFVEAFGFHPSRAERAFDLAVQARNEFNRSGLPASIVPHSPYSVSELLFRKIQAEAVQNGGILSIHNQESQAEEQFFNEGTGAIAEHLQQNIGLDLSQWQAGRGTSLNCAMEFLPAKNTLLLVHNTFTSENDLQDLELQRSMENTFLVLCPGSNLYIENALPPVELFRKYGLNICLGTDSLASNSVLSILKEMTTLQQHFPEIQLEELISWACVNGAKALHISDTFGSFDTGKKPGVNLLTGVQLKNLQLTEHTKVKRLL